jgi:hypothetical protein
VITLQGSLKSFKLPDILTFLNMSRKSGTLNLISGKRESFVYFDQGSVVYASSNQEKFRLSAILIWRKRITNEQWRDIERIMLDQGEKFGKVAVEQKILTEDELREFLKIQVSEIIYDCFTWDDGRFSFLEMMKLPDHAVTISIDLANLIMEGARRIDEWEHCLDLLPDKRVRLKVVPTPEIREKISLTLDEWKILFLINGARSLEEICDVAEEDRLHVYRIVYGLVANKLVETVHREPSLISMIREMDFKGEAYPPVEDATTHNVLDDTSLLVSPEAHLGFKDVLSVTLARLTVRKPEMEASGPISLVEQEYRIGRQPEVDIHIPDPSVSNFHARIYRGPEGYVIEDQASRNGTFVNGTRIQRRLLQENDVIYLGAAEMVYNIVSDVKEVPAAV